MSNYSTLPYASQILVARDMLLPTVRELLKLGFRIDVVISVFSGATMMLEHLKYNKHELQEFINEPR